MELCNIGMLTQHYTASQPRRRRSESSQGIEHIKSRTKSYSA